MVRIHVDDDESGEDDALTVLAALAGIRTDSQQRFDQRAAAEAASISIDGRWGTGAVSLIRLTQPAHHEAMGCPPFWHTAAREGRKRDGRTLLSHIAARSREKSSGTPPFVPPSVARALGSLEFLPPSKYSLHNTGVFSPLTYFHGSSAAVDEKRATLSLYQHVEDGPGNSLSDHLSIDEKMQAELPVTILDGILAIGWFVTVLDVVLGAAHSLTLETQAFHSQMRSMQPELTTLSLSESAHYVAEILYAVHLSVHRWVRQQLSSTEPIAVPRLCEQILHKINVRAWVPPTLPKMYDPVAPTPPVRT